MISRTRWAVESGKRLKSRPEKPCPRCGLFDFLKIIPYRSDMNDSQFVRMVACVQCEYFPRTAFGISDDMAISDWDLKLPK